MFTSPLKKKKRGVALPSQLPPGSSLLQQLRLLDQPRERGAELARRRAVLALEELGPGQDAARGTALAAA